MPDARIDPSLAGGPTVAGALARGAQQIGDVIQRAEDRKEVMNRQRQMAAAQSQILIGVAKGKAAAENALPGEGESAFNQSREEAQDFVDQMTDERAQQMAQINLDAHFGVALPSVKNRDFKRLRESTVQKSLGTIDRAIQSMTNNVSDAEQIIIEATINQNLEIIKQNVNTDVFIRLRTQTENRLFNFDIDRIETGRGDEAALTDIRQRISSGRLTPDQLGIARVQEERLRIDVRQNSVAAINAAVDEVVRSDINPTKMRSEIENRIGDLMELSDAEKNSQVDRALLEVVDEILSGDDPDRIEQAERIKPSISSDPAAGAAFNKMIKSARSAVAAENQVNVKLMLTEQASIQASERFQGNKGNVALAASIQDITYLDEKGKKQTILAKDIEEDAYNKELAGPMIAATALALGIEPVEFVSMSQSEAVSAIRAAQSDPQIQSKLEAAETQARVNTSISTKHTDEVLRTRLSNSLITNLAGGTAPKDVPESVVEDFRLFTLLETAGMGRRTAGAEASKLFDNTRLSIDLGVAVGADQDSLIRDAISKAIRPRFENASPNTGTDSPLQVTIAEVVKELGVDAEKEDRVARDLTRIVKESMSMGNSEFDSIQKAKAVILDGSVAINKFMTSIRDIPIGKDEFVLIGGHLIDFAAKINPKETEAAGGTEGLRIDYDPRIETLEITSADLFGQPLFSLTKKQLMEVSARFNDLVEGTLESTEDIAEVVLQERRLVGEPTFGEIVLEAAKRGPIGLFNALLNPEAVFPAKRVSPIVGALPIPEKTGDPEVDKVLQFISTNLANRSQDRLEQELKVAERRERAIRDAPSNLLMRSP